MQCLSSLEGKDLSRSGKGLRVALRHIAHRQQQNADGRAKFDGFPPAIDVGNHDPIINSHIDGPIDPVDRTLRCSSHSDIPHRLTSSNLCDFLRLRADRVNFLYNPHWTFISRNSVPRGTPRRCGRTPRVLLPRPSACL